MEDNFVIDGLVEQREELERLLMTNPAMEKKVQGLIRKVLVTVRREIGEGIEFKHGDPRQAYKAVKTAVYRQILGGSVSILNKRKRSTQFSAYEPPRTLRPGQRGGNRRTRSQRTWDLVHYAGPDRGFILRFLNAGTQVRGVDFTYKESRKVDKWNKHPNTGYRHKIAPRNFFGRLAPSSMNRASEQLTQLIDELIKKELK